MVREVSAYEASDGSIFASKSDAAKHDALLQIKHLGAFNHATALAIVDKAVAIYTAIAPLVQAAKLEDCANAEHD